MKRHAIVITILLSCMLVLMACSENSSSNKPNQANEESKTEKQKKASDKNQAMEASKVLDRETTDFSESNHKEKTILDARFPEHGNYPFAHKGMFILTGNYSSHFYDYQNGKMPDFDLNGHGDPWLDTSSLIINQFEQYFYTIEEDYQSEKKYVVEVNIDTGKKKELIEVENDYIMGKKDDILYLESTEDFIAFDTKKEKILWKVDTDSDLYFYDVFLTDHSVVLLSDEGLAVYNQEDGEKLYEVEGFFHDAVVDGENFYVIESNEETIMDLNRDRWDILKFNENSEESELLFTTPDVSTTYEFDDTYLSLEGNSIYVKVRFGVLVYDKNDGSLLSATSLDGDLNPETTLEGPSYDFKTAFHNDKIYTRTSAWENGPDETTISIIDAKTGEIKENYSFGRGEAFGPVFDGENVVVLHWLEDGDPKIYILE